MKIINLIIISMLLTVFISCGKSHNDNSGPGLPSGGGELRGLNGQSTALGDKLLNNNFCFDINEDGKKYIVMLDFNEPAKLILTAEEVPEGELKPARQEGTWQLDGNKLTVKIGNGENDSAPIAFDEENNMLIGVEGNRQMFYNCN